MGMLWVCFLAPTQLYRLGKGIAWVRDVNSGSSSSSDSSDSSSSSSSDSSDSSSPTQVQGRPSTDPEAYPRSVPPKNTPKRAKQAYPVVWGMLVSLNP